MSGYWITSDRVVLTVRDNGKGIRPKDSKRLFEPFFTTKSAVEGAGLELSISFGFVKAHGGTIKAKSARGMTVFMVELPQGQASDRAQGDVAG